MERSGKEMEQGFQGWEYKFNSVSSSRGDYPFITVTAGDKHFKIWKTCHDQDASGASGRTGQGRT